MTIDPWGLIPIETTFEEPTFEETEIQRVNEIIKYHRDAVVEFLKQKYPEDFI